jgi:hypothetical protein
MKSRQSGVPLKLMLLAAVLYVILPADLIPDVIPVAGWLDDLGLMALVTGWLATAYSRYKRRPPSTPTDAPHHGSEWDEPDEGNTGERRVGERRDGQRRTDDERRGDARRYVDSDPWAPPPEP